MNYLNFIDLRACLNDKTKRSFEDIIALLLNWADDDVQGDAVRYASDHLKDWPYCLKCLSISPDSRYGLDHFQRPELRESDVLTKSFIKSLSLSRSVHVYEFDINLSRILSDEVYPVSGGFFEGMNGLETVEFEECYIDKQAIRCLSPDVKSVSISRNRNNLLYGDLCSIIMSRFSKIESLDLTDSGIGNDFNENLLKEMEHLKKLNLDLNMIGVDKVCLISDMCKEIGIDLSISPQRA